MKEIVKYNNKVNRIALAGWGERDMNIFFTLLCQARDEGTAKLEFNIADIRRAAGVTTHKLSNKDFMELVGKSALIKWSLFRCLIVDEEKRNHVISVFEDIAWNERVMSFKMTESFVDLVNDLEHFTMFELKRFIAIDGKYAKTLFRNLSQFNNNGDNPHHYSVSIADFRQIYCVPKTYDSKAIMKEIIKPSMKELKEDFYDLKCVVNYDDTKKGNPVKGYTFYWTDIPRNTQKEEIVDSGRGAVARAISGEIKRLLEENHKEYLEEDLISRLPDTPEDGEEIPF